MQLTIVKIIENGSDEAVTLNGNIILTCDPSCGDDVDQIKDVANNLAETLNVSIEYIEHSPEVDWDWDEVIKDLFE